MARHAQSPEVQLAALQLFNCLCGLSHQERESLVKGGGVDLVLVALGTHFRHTSVAHEALQALARAATVPQPVETWKLIVQASHSVMALLPADPKVAAAALQTLRQHARQIPDSSSVDAVVDAARRHVDCDQVILSAMQALSSMAMHEEARIAVWKAGGHMVLIQALRDRGCGVDVEQPSISEDLLIGGLRSLANIVLGGASLQADTGCDELTNSWNELIAIPVSVMTAAHGDAVWQVLSHAAAALYDDA